MKRERPVTHDIEQAVIMLEMVDAVFSACSDIAFHDGERGVMDKAWHGLMIVTAQTIDSLRGVNRDLLNEVRAAHGLRLLDKEGREVGKAKAVAG